MAWPKDHKRNTRERIIEAAASAFRQRGIDEVGVADVMRDAGLTHGGFYAHFASKDDLLAAAVAYASSQVTEMVETRGASNAQKGLLGAAFIYLSSAHCAHPEWGCPIASLGPDLARSSAKAQRALTADIKKRLKQLLDLTPTEMPAEARRRQAAGAFACMVGGLIIARGLGESDGLAFLKDCKRFLEDALGDGDGSETV
jgi:TetR/AcrR family transcriptional regulator, transcriptional repressor for nem operon